MQQLTLFSTPRTHGGDAVLGKRKTLRPLSTKEPIHFTLCSKVNLHRIQEEVLMLLCPLAVRFGLEMYATACNTTHMHFLTKIPSRAEYNKFIRSFTGLLARRHGRGMWESLPYTRVAHWGRDFRNLQDYVLKNQLEALGWVEYTPRR